MADNSIFIRVVRGETSMVVALVVTTLMMGGYFAYEYFVPRLSDVFVPFFNVFRMTLFTYTILAVHNACHEAGLLMRLLARTYVVILFLCAVYLAFAYYGIIGAFAYPIVLFVAHFLLRD